MIDENEVRNQLVAKQTELQQRIAGTQATERKEVADKKNDDAQLWSVSDVRDDLDSQASEELQQVDQALERLSAGEYGTCVECGEPIGDARLRVQPYATMCIKCAEEAEHDS